jgi:hypothetical protein
MLSDPARETSQAPTRTILWARRSPTQGTAAHRRANRRASTRNRVDSSVEFTVHNLASLRSRHKDSRSHRRTSRHTVPDQARVELRLVDLQRDLLRTITTSPTAATQVEVEVDHREEVLQGEVADHLQEVSHKEEYHQTMDSRMATVGRPVGVETLPKVSQPATMTSNWAHSPDLSAGSGSPRGHLPGCLVASWTTRFELN